MQRRRPTPRPLIPSVLLTVAALAGLSAPSFARPDEYRDNVREACRQAVAGAYLKVYDERERTIDYVAAVAKSLAETGEGLKAARKRLAKAKADADKTTFDTERAVKLDQAAAEVSVLEAQKAEYQRLHDTSKAKVASLVQTERDLRKEVEAVFVFNRIEDKADGGYPIRLEYKSACPKFRYLCPLPREQAAKLAALEINGEVPLACKRYASLSKIQ